MTETHPSGPTPRVRREEVRRRLLAAAARVFAERGYEDSRVEDIAHAAGFTKGAVYSNFGSKQGLFGAILGEGSDGEHATVLGEVRDIDEPAAAVSVAARLVARRIVGDTERGRLGLELAARAAHDEQARDVVTPMRRAQRAAAARSVDEVVERTGAQPAVSPELAGLILHCLTNGLSMEHLADPEEVGVEAVEQALSAVLAALIDPPDQGSRPKDL
ncbi:TetR/AcrR family transcriptional regulator [Streptomyces sp. NPDC050560]|uniref:TetR/AcrR family transcriptional regulator n=1 Tax=Streptomyces sp. NPDC050560 TaxID=3365630 RepID=UPI0037B2DA96